MKDSLTFTVIPSLAAIPAVWVLVVKPDMFGDPSTYSNPKLFSFSGQLYAYNDLGLFRVEMGSCYEWTKLYTPLPPDSARFVPVGGTYSCPEGAAVRGTGVLQPGHV
ncbi:hypothetical protein DRJ54_03120 [Candidatus Acetothermia bacterium]|nr:MAG: hypothetical protein DRJ54_03120 [Candidatus Acetothermia bacterium]